MMREDMLKCQQEMQRARLTTRDCERGGVVIKLSCSQAIPEPYVAFQYAVSHRELIECSERQLENLELELIQHYCEKYCDKCRPECIAEKEDGTKVWHYPHRP